MIRIRKPNCPAVLTTQGAAATLGLHAEYDHTPTAFRRGTKRFSFAESIYAHNEVKAALRLAQNDKCAFCESKITHIDYGDIEHFRPKGGVRQHDSRPMKYPGYYWLAYSWDNLFLSCQICNQRFKGNCFPLLHPTQRVRTHRGKLSRESPLLLCPADSPDSHLTFVNELAVPTNESEVGRVTIELLGLNRDELLNRRRDRRNVLLALRDAYQLLTAQTRDDPSSESQGKLHDLIALLVDAVSDAAEYAAMARVTLG